jgi:hypothetical protein
VRAIAVIVGRVSIEVFKFSSLHLYQKCPFKTFHGLYNISKASKTSTPNAAYIYRNRSKRGLHLPQSLDLILAGGTVVLGEYAE